jgi:hypothetical protein
MPRPCWKTSRIAPNAMPLVRTFMTAPIARGEQAAECHGEQHEPQRDDDGEEQRDLGEQGAGGVVVAGGDAAD